MHMAVAILRVEKGLDYSRIMNDDNEKQTVSEEQRIHTNDSTTDLLANSQVHGSNDSLSRNGSQGIRPLSTLHIHWRLTILAFEWMNHSICTI